MRNTLHKVLEEHTGLCYESTAMALELICESLFYQHGIDARWKGRSIYVGEKRVASIETSQEGYKNIAIYKYYLL